MEMRVRTSAGVYLWVESCFCFSGTRVRAPEMAIAGPPAYLTARVIHSASAVLCRVARYQQRQEGATLHARLPEHHLARRTHASEQHQGARFLLRASLLALFLTGVSRWRVSFWFIQPRLCRRQTPESCSPPWLQARVCCSPLFRTSCSRSGWTSTTVGSLELASCSLPASRLTTLAHAGKCDITVSAVDIRALAADVVRTASVGLARQSGTTIVLHADDTLPQSVESSAEHLELLLLNLTVFCVRASEALPVCVSVRCDQADAAVPTTMRLVLEVCVRGQALSAEQAEAAFEPYAQDSTATAEALQRASQSRLGLHVSRRLVEALGGRLTIRSSEEDGTCFTACIPVPPTQQTLAPLSRAASFTQAPAFEEDPDDPGIRPFLPPELKMSASFTALRDGGHMPELFDLLLANSDDGFYIGDNITFRYASPGLLRMLQYEDAKEEMYSIPILEFLHPDDLPSNAAAWEESKAETATRNGAAVYRKYMYRIRKRDGSYLWIEAVTVQTPETFYGMMRDIDDRKSLESSLKEFLTSTMSDFRQPLTGIAAAAELLAQQDCVRRDADAAFMVAAIASATRMLSGIVANVLSMRSLEAGDCEVADAPFSIRDCMAGVLSVCRMSLTHSDSTAIRWVDEEAPLPALVRGDADRFAQILLNLCSNAVRALSLWHHRGPNPCDDLCVLSILPSQVKFADGSNITVSVRCESVGDSSTSMLLSLRVTDGGRGMSEAERDRAFESYVRAPTHMGGGTGLGLYICKRFAEAMGGSISVDTAPGCGACFTVSVPVVAVAPDAAAAAPPMPPTQACNQAYTSAGAAEAGQPMDHALLDLAPAQQAHALATQSTPEPERRCRVLLVGAWCVFVCPSSCAHMMARTQMTTG